VIWSIELRAETFGVSSHIVGSLREGFSVFLQNLCSSPGIEEASIHYELDGDVLDTLA
jgi:hypothetical protein